MRLLTFSHLLMLPTHSFSAITVVAALALPAKLNTALPIPGLLDHSPPTSLVLRRRLNNVWQSFLGPEGWQVNYITFAHILPLQLAAFALQELYQAAAVSANTYRLTYTPASNVVVISIRGFRLTLSSNELIPWALVRAFALRMWTVSGAGFTPGCTIDFTGSNETVLRASLRVSGANRGSSSSKPLTPRPESGR